MDMFLHKNNVKKAKEAEVAQRRVQVDKDGKIVKPALALPGAEEFKNTLTDFSSDENKAKWLAACMARVQDRRASVLSSLQDARAVISAMETFVDDPDLLDSLCVKIEKVYKTFRANVDDLARCQEELDRAAGSVNKGGL